MTPTQQQWVPHTKHFISIDNIPPRQNGNLQVSSIIAIPQTGKETRTVQSLARDAQSGAQSWGAIQFSGARVGQGPNRACRLPTPRVSRRGAPGGAGRGHPPAARSARAAQSSRARASISAAAGSGQRRELGCAARIPGRARTLAQVP